MGTRWAAVAASGSAGLDNPPGCWPSSLFSKSLLSANRYCVRRCAKHWKAIKGKTLFVHLRRLIPSIR